jgi:DNA-binding NarL/FixJ family response regulator
MLNVLLVEDHPIFREAIKRNLLEHFDSIIIEEAATGEEALQKVKESPPHLIMDIRDCFLVKESLKGYEIAEFVKSVSR